MSERKVRFAFSVAEANQLLSYVHGRDSGADAGWYYGHKGQFEQRHKRLIDELNNWSREPAKQGDSNVRTLQRSLT